MLFNVLHHVVNLIVKKDLKLIHVWLKKVKDLVKYMTNSEGGKLNLEEITLGLGIVYVKGLWLDCPTR